MLQTYKRKFAYPICGYTGYSAKHCRQRQQNVLPYRQVPYDEQSQEDILNQRQQLKTIMKDTPEKNEELDSGYDEQEENQ